MRNLACASRRAHDRAQEYVNADSSISKTVAVGGKLRAIVVGNALQECDIQATDEHSLARQCDTGRGLAFGNQNKIRSEIRPNIIMCFVLRPTFVLVQHGTCSRSAPELFYFMPFGPPVPRTVFASDFRSWADVAVRSGTCLVA